MARFMRAIHVLLWSRKKVVDGPVKPGHDGEAAQVAITAAKS
jgi:hypothetical protein